MPNNIPHPEDIWKLRDGRLLKIISVTQFGDGSDYSIRYDLQYPGAAFSEFTARSFGLREFRLMTKGGRIKEAENERK